MASGFATWPGNARIQPSGRARSSGSTKTSRKTEAKLAGDGKARAKNGKARAKTPNVNLYLDILGRQNHDNYRVVDHHVLKPCEFLWFSET